MTAIFVFFRKFILIMALIVGMSAGAVLVVMQMTQHQLRSTRSDLLSAHAQEVVQDIEHQTELVATQLTQLAADEDLQSLLAQTQFSSQSAQTASFQDRVNQEVVPLTEEYHQLNVLLSQNHAQQNADFAVANVAVLDAWGQVVHSSRQRVPSNMGATTWWPDIKSGQSISQPFTWDGNQEAFVKTTTVPVFAASPPQLGADKEDESTPSPVVIGAVRITLELSSWELPSDQLAILKSESAALISTGSVMEGEYVERAVSLKADSFAVLPSNQQQFYCQADTVDSLPNITGITWCSSQSNLTGFADFQSRVSRQASLAAALGLLVVLVLALIGHPQNTTETKLKEEKAESSSERNQSTTTDETSSGDNTSSSKKSEAKKRHQVTVYVCPGKCGSYSNYAGKCQRPVCDNYQQPLEPMTRPGAEAVLGFALTGFSSKYGGK